VRLIHRGVGFYFVTQIPRTYRPTSSPARQPRAARAGAPSRRDEKALKAAAARSETPFYEVEEILTTRHREALSPVLAPNGSPTPPSRCG